jgi:hypothetical protein
MHRINPPKIYPMAARKPPKMSQMMLPRKFIQWRVFRSGQSVRPACAN